VWGIVCTTTPEKLQKVQNRAVRVATNSCLDDASEPLMQELGWLTIEQLIELETVKVVYRALLFFKLSDTSDFSTDLYIPHSRTSMGKKSLVCGGGRCWIILTGKGNSARIYSAFKRIFCGRIEH